MTRTASDSTLFGEIVTIIDSHDVVTSVRSRLLDQRRVFVFLAPEPITTGVRFRRALELPVIEAPEDRVFRPVLMRSSGSREAGIAGAFWARSIGLRPVYRAVPPRVVRRVGAWRAGRRPRLPAWMRAVRKLVRDAAR